MAERLGSLRRDAVVSMQRVTGLFNTNYVEHGEKEYDTKLVTTSSDGHVVETPLKQAENIRAQLKEELKREGVKTQATIETSSKQAVPPLKENDIIGDKTAERRERSEKRRDRRRCENEEGRNHTVWGGKGFSVNDAFNFQTRSISEKLLEQPSCDDGINGINSFNWKVPGQSPQLPNAMPIATASTAGISTTRKQQVQLPAGSEAGSLSSCAGGSPSWNVGKNSKRDVLPFPTSVGVKCENNMQLEPRLKIEQKSSLDRVPSNNQISELDTSKLDPCIVQFVDAILAALLALPQDSLVDILRRLKQTRSSDVALAMVAAQVPGPHDSQIAEPTNAFAADFAPGSTTPSIADNANTHSMAAPPKMGGAQMTQSNEWPIQNVIEFPSSPQTPFTLPLAPRHPGWNNVTPDPTPSELAGTATSNSVATSVSFGDSATSPAIWSIDTPNTDMPRGVPASPTPATSWPSLGEVSVQQDGAWPPSPRQSPQFVPHNSQHVPANAVQHTTSPGPQMSPVPVFENTFPFPSPWPTSSPKPGRSPMMQNALEKPTGSPPATIAHTSWPTSVFSPSVAQTSPIANRFVGEGTSGGTSLPAPIELAVAAAAAAAAPWPQALSPLPNPWNQQPAW